MGNVRTNSSGAGPQKYYAAKLDDLQVSPFVQKVRKNEFVTQDKIETGANINLATAVNVQDAQSVPLGETSAVVVYLSSHKLYVTFAEMTSSATLSMKNTLQISAESIYTFKLLHKGSNYYVAFSGRNGTYAVGIELNLASKSFSIGSVLTVGTTTYCKLSNAVDNYQYPIVFDAVFFENSSTFLIVTGGSAANDDNAVRADIYAVETNGKVVTLKASKTDHDFGGVHGFGIVAVNSNTILFSGGFYSGVSSGIRNGDHYVSAIQLNGSTITVGTNVSIPFPIKNTSGSTSSYSDYQWRFGVTSSGVKLVGNTILLVIFDAIYGNNFYGSCVDIWFATVSGTSVTVNKGLNLYDFSDIGVGRIKDCKILLKDEESFTFDILINGLKQSYESSNTYVWSLRVSTASVLANKLLTSWTYSMAPAIIGGVLEGLTYENAFDSLLLLYLGTNLSSLNSNSALRVYNTGYSPLYVKPYDGKGNVLGIATKSANPLETVPILSGGSGEVIV